MVWLIKLHCVCLVLYWISGLLSEYFLASEKNDIVETLNELGEENLPQRVIHKSTRSYFSRPGLLYLSGLYFTPALNQDQPLQVYSFILSFLEA